MLVVRHLLRYSLLNCCKSTLSKFYNANLGHSLALIEGGRAQPAWLRVGPQRMRVGQEGEPEGKLCDGQVDRVFRKRVCTN
eukprot:scaffold131917_cov72-Phaeocystis_antarctica.AAC.2